MRKHYNPYLIRSIAEQHRLLGLTSPKHPMVSVFRFEDMAAKLDLPTWYALDFYCISIKKNFTGKMRYGQRYYDYDAGVMAFMSPQQVLSNCQETATSSEGICLCFHPSILHGHVLASTITSYGFFSYEINEALHLSAQEEQVLGDIYANIEAECSANIDVFSQAIIIAQIELLLQYSNRFYNRQFITRKPANDEILIRLEALLIACFDEAHLQKNGIPTVEFVADSLSISRNYLSDMLRSITGQTTQQHIHAKLISKAKELLTGTSLPVREIAYKLGFDYPQSFNKLFKNKTALSPLKFRQGFN